MTIIYSIIRFTDNAEEELALLTQEMRLKRVVESIAPSAPIPEELKADLRQRLAQEAHEDGRQGPHLGGQLETARLGRELGRQGPGHQSRDQPKDDPQAEERQAAAPQWRRQQYPECADRLHARRASST